PAFADDGAQEDLTQQETAAEQAEQGTAGGQGTAEQEAAGGQEPAEQEAAGGQEPAEQPEEAEGQGLPLADGDVVISEIHYDNAGVDTGEAIEVQAPVGTDLTGWALVLYNGSNGGVYDTDPLPTPVPDAGVVVVDYPANGIQNGSPDGVALVDADGTVVELLSYEGELTATDGPAAGLT